MWRAVKFISSMVNFNKTTILSFFHVSGILFMEVPSAENKDLEIQDLPVSVSPLIMTISLSRLILLAFLLE